MKRAYALFLALLLILTGCTGKGKTNNISVKDAACPYKISHQKNEVEITLQDGEKRGILWQVEVMPQGICQVTEENVDKENTHKYLITGTGEGTAKVTFTAAQEDGTVVFVLTVAADVDANGKAVVSAYQHQQREDTSVEADGFAYEWNIDLDGTLHFYFMNEEEFWSVDGDGEGVCTVINTMSTPSGCEISLRGKAEGKTVITLTGRDTGRKIDIVIQVDDSGKPKVVSVQEQ